MSPRARRGVLKCSFVVRQRFVPAEYAPKNRFDVPQIQSKLYKHDTILLSAFPITHGHAGTGRRGRYLELRRDVQSALVLAQVVVVFRLPDHLIDRLQDSTATGLSPPQGGKVGRGRLVGKQRGGE